MEAVVDGSVYACEDGIVKRVALVAVLAAGIGTLAVVSHRSPSVREAAPTHAHPIATAVELRHDSAPSLPSVAAVDPRPRATSGVSEARFERGAPLSSFVSDASDRFAYQAVAATDDERRQANALAVTTQAAIDEAVELSHDKIDKAEAVRRIQQAYADRAKGLDHIFGAERARVLGDIRIADGIEIADDADSE